MSCDKNRTFHVLPKGSTSLKSFGGFRYQIAAKYTDLNEESILHIAKECLISFRFDQLWHKQ